MDMREVYGVMEYRKFISEEIVVGTITTTTLGYAEYANSSTVVIEGYSIPADTGREIWRIKQLVSNTATGVTETFYPDGAANKSFAWDDRATLNYI